MKCKHCDHKYPANRSAIWPGGFDSPGPVFYLTLLFAAGTAILFLFTDSAWRWIVGGITGLCAFTVLTSWFSCHGPAGFSDTGGETCPECKGRNTVYPWSF